MLGSITIKINGSHQNLNASRRLTQTTIIMDNFWTKGICVLLLSFWGYSGLAQTTEVDVNLNVNHIVGDIDELQRKKFISIHADVSDRDWYEDINFSNNLISDFLNGYDVYIGRNTGGIQWIMNSVINQDPTRPGFADTAHIASEGTKRRNNYANNSAWHTYESRHNQILCTQQFPFYPNGQQTNKGWAFSQTDTETEPFGTASGEFYGHYIKNFFGNGGNTGQPAPSFIEVTNEPLWYLSDEIDNVFKFHSTVAKEVRKVNPDALVAGYCTAFPNLEEDNFQRWENRWKKFMDVSGEDMDAWSLHLYDFPSISNGQKRLRRGSNMEATLDMLEHYSMIKFGEVKPFVISEYGASSHDYFGPWSPYADYLHNTAANAQVMQFMERPQHIGQTINYTMLKATWGTPSVNNTWQARLLIRENEPVSLSGDWIFSDRVHFYQLWANVKGKRIDSKSTNLDILTDAYVEGNKAYVALNNLAWSDRQITLNLFEDNDIAIQELMVKDFRLGDDAPVLDENRGSIDTLLYTAGNIPNTFTIGGEGTMILEYTFATDLSLSDTSTEVKYYATDYYKPIAANTSLEFQINDIVLGTEGEATLRLGLGRNHGKSLVPVVQVNGTAVEVPVNFRGDAQVDRATFFGVIEIEVPYSLLQEDNTISVNFPDAGGHVSSVAMQVYNFTKALTRTTSIQQEVSSVETVSVYPNPAQQHVIFEVPNSQPFSLVLHDLTGRVVYRGSSVNGEKVDVSTLQSGLYLYTLETASESFRGRLIVEN